MCCYGYSTQFLKLMYRTIMSAILLKGTTDIFLNYLIELIRFAILLDVDQRVYSQRVCFFLVFFLNFQLKLYCSRPHTGASRTAFSVNCEPKQVEHVVRARVHISHIAPRILLPSSFRHIAEPVRQSRLQSS